MNHPRYLRLQARTVFMVDTEPDADDMAAINKLAGAELAPSDVHVRSCLAINTRRMTMGIQVPEDGVRAIAGMAVDKPIQRNHDTYTSDGLPIGRVFSSTAMRDGDDMACMQRFYLMRDPMTDSLVRRMDGGIIKEVSCSFGFDRMECSIDGGDMWECSHVPNESYDGKMCTGLVRGINEYFETSLVWMGAASGTRIGMSLSRDGQFDDFERVIRDRRFTRELESVFQLPTGILPDRAPSLFG